MLIDSGEAVCAEPEWFVLLVGGASGVGKTSISYRLARHFGAGLTEVDDFTIILEAMTSPQEYPEFHFWRTNYDEAVAMDDAGQLDFFQRYARRLEPALELVIANHLETQTRVVLEGDFILPSVAVRERYQEEEAGGRVKALFLTEPDEAQIASNFARRYDHEQATRVRTSRIVGEWLRAEAVRLGVPVLEARPWESVLERAIKTAG